LYRAILITAEVIKVMLPSSSYTTHNRITVGICYAAQFI